MCMTKGYLFPRKTHVTFAKESFTFFILTSILHRSVIKLFVPEYDTRVSTVFQCLKISIMLNPLLSNKTIYFLTYTVLVSPLTMVRR